MRGRILGASRRSNGVRNDVLTLDAPANSCDSIMVIEANCKTQANCLGLHFAHFAESVRSFYLTGVSFLLDSGSLNENNRLRTGNFKATATSNIPARQHIVDAYQVVARFLKTRLVLFVCAPRRLWLACALQPAHVVLGAFAAMRTTIRRLLYLFLFVKKITFIHDYCSLYHESRITRAGSENYKFR